MLLFRVVVVDEQRAALTLGVQLDRCPDVGRVLELPHGASVTVRQVLSGDRDGFDGVVLAGPD